ncbi:hypothetical protein CC2G_003423 [Coprinopsis cinerea AmutBmut pab1-1]|nr:hypothetical protein CC2G_003423 [Coprinopsis cinerea AmutBmut pab1-1]
MSLEIPRTTDVVFIDTLQTAANIGADCWGKARPQPLEISIYLHLQPTFLNKAGRSDDVVDSVHYGHLTKAVSNLIRVRSSEQGDGGNDGFEGVEGLANQIADEAFALAGDVAEAVRIVISAPKLVLLASNFVVDTLIPRTRQSSTRTVSILGLTLPVIIGVNPPERLAKQNVVTDIIFYENPDSPVPYEQYKTVLGKITAEMETSEYHTLEKFVMKIVRRAVLYLRDLSVTSVQAVTARSQKPSALSFARFSGVEITRRFSDIVPPSPK